MFQPQLSLDLPVGGLFLPLALNAGKSPMLLSLPSNSHRGFNSLPRYPHFCVVSPSCEGGTTGEPHRASPSSRPVFMLFKAWPHLHLLTACLPWRTAPLPPPRAGALSLSPQLCSLHSISVITTANDDEHSEFQERHRAPRLLH